MTRMLFTSAAVTLLATTLAIPAQAQQATRPTFQTTKVEGTDNVYVFRYQGHQSMFVVTKAGVIATDPIGLGRPQAVVAYIEEIKKVTDKPIKYVVYSHHHFDHIAGGKPFKDLGATFVAHQNAKARIQAVNHPDVVVPDQTVRTKKAIKLGGTALELSYVGRNHSDNSLVMRLPKEKIIFVVDWIPVRSVQWRNLPDSWPVETEESIKKVLAMDWERMIPGHPGPGGRLGTREDVQAQLQYLQDLSAETKKAVSEGKCYETAMKEIKLPKYATWGNYEQWLSGNIERYCHHWRVGI